MGSDTGRVRLTSVYLTMPSSTKKALSWKFPETFDTNYLHPKTLKFKMRIQIVSRSLCENKQRKNWFPRVARCSIIVKKWDIFNCFLYRWKRHRDVNREKTHPAVSLSTNSVTILIIILKNTLSKVSKILGMEFLPHNYSISIHAFSNINEFCAGIYILLVEISESGCLSGD